MGSEDSPVPGKQVKSLHVPTVAAVGGGTGAAVGASIGIAVAGTAVSAMIPLAIIGLTVFGGAAYIKNLRDERTALRPKLDKPPEP